MISDRTLARAFQVPLELLPYVPELLADLWDLGGWPDVIADLLRPLGLPASSTRVLDLGAGKGAVSIHIAERLGFRAHGVDFFEPFVTEARARAAERGVEHLCTFELADMRDAVDKHRGYDVAIYASIGGVLGDLSQCVQRLSETVRPGGYLIVDDGYLAGSERLDCDGHGHYVSHEQTTSQLTAHGDALIREVLIPADDVRAVVERYIEAIARRARDISARQPELSEALNQHVELQRTESDVWEKRVVSAVWLLMKK